MNDKEALEAAVGETPPAPKKLTELQMAQFQALLKDREIAALKAQIVSSFQASVDAAMTAWAEPVAKELALKTPLTIANDGTVTGA